MQAIFKGKAYGAVTVGERGQLVIPAELRKALNIKPGDHLDLVAEQHEDARATLANMSPADAISVADELLKNALR